MSYIPCDSEGSFGLEGIWFRLLKKAPLPGGFVAACSKEVMPVYLGETQLK